MSLATCGHMVRALWIVAALGCGGGGASHSDAAIPGDAPPDAVTRSYRLAATGTQVDPATGAYLGDTNLADDVDVIAIHQDFYGVPWTAFENHTAPPAAWVATMQTLVQHAAGHDVFLSLTPLDGDRQQLAPDVNADGTLARGWSPTCYDLGTAADGPALRAAYTAYVTYMVNLFHPRWVNVAIEVNLFHVYCPAQWAGMVELEQAAYAAAKTAAPDVPAFPSIQINALDGDAYATEYAALSGLTRDRFAISAYPYAVPYATPADIPPDWLTRAAAQGGERLFIAETGWLGTDLVAIDPSGACSTILSDPPQDQADYLDLLVATAKANDVEVITWFSDRDAVDAPMMTDCPCTYSQPWCALVAYFRAQGGSDPTAQFAQELGLKTFGTLGIRDYTGTPRLPVYSHWQAARAATLEP
ncbi:MAG TPA: hypothetical protein VGF94_06545 [Kofleriaceae bacterium]|jgi:hypothetical protein